jgi:hypothetical protein
MKKQTKSDQNHENVKSIFTTFEVVIGGLKQTFPKRKAEKYNDYWFCTEAKLENNYDIYNAPCKPCDTIQEAYRWVAKTGKVFAERYAEPFSL